ncbi:hypothetical protein GIB67_013780 [Kingdonia uniflora]|uniref:Uncharacterized protein n=1 Tax=Kingdonia uniflora TaxID=39325 RepID=A0A7J7MN84_9MAGN|nr:hypothetical protein GIB67_013780 [Kingdonia uniflora]
MLHHSGYFNGAQIPSKTPKQMLDTICWSYHSVRSLDFPKPHSFLFQGRFACQLELITRIEVMPSFCVLLDFQHCFVIKFTYPTWDIELI